MDGTGNNQLGDLLNGLMSNPEAINTLSGLMKSMSSSQAEAPSDQTQPSEVIPANIQETQAPGQEAGAFSGINPDMLKMLPSIMSMLGPMINQNKPDPQDSSGNDTEAQTDDAVETSAAAAGGHHHHHNHRTAEQRNKLLYALKPYLSHSRREAVEQIAKITQITDMLGETGILTSFRGEAHVKESRDGKISEPDKNLGMIHKT